MNRAEGTCLTHMSSPLCCCKTYHQEVYAGVSSLWVSLIPKEERTGMAVRLHLPGALVTSGHLSGAHWSLV